MNSDRVARPHRYQVPDREAVAGWLRELAAGEVTREAAAEWAMEYVLYDNPQIYPEIRDRAVWKAIKRIGGADTLIAPDTYLYLEADFTGWLDELTSIEGS